MVHAPRSSDSRCLQSRQECADGNASVIAADSSASVNASDVAAARLQLDSLCPLQAPARLPFAPYASSSRLRCLATSKLSALGIDPTSLSVPQRRAARRFAAVMVRRKAADTDRREFLSSERAAGGARP